ncbi:MAG: lysophospholipid acyltransferase family protein [Patescibacteria group bacterium]|nr:lysophospholipid acyltransferase family protein [Patescibacteria group bacterium]MDD5715887.1 lysophospholipid acyltransferase family protein [Patescibacteria group bacterium]
MKTPWHWYALFAPYLRSVVGKENIPAGPCIIAANHESTLDALVLVWAFRRRISFVAEARLQKRLLPRFFVYFIGESVPNNGGTAVDRCIQECERGKTICLFPEGDVHPRFRTERLRTGVAVISHRAQTPIVPVHISGTGAIWPVTNTSLHFGRFRSVTITIGEPIMPPPAVEECPRQAYERATAELYQKIRNLGGVPGTPA